MLKFLKFLRRGEPQDAFGGEDLFDGEPRAENFGPKVALIGSGVLFLALMGTIGAIVMLGEPPPPATMGTLADLEVVEEGATAADATAATDRDVERRPWLRPTTPPAETGSRLMGTVEFGGGNSTPEPAAPADPAVAATEPAATPAGNEQNTETAMAPAAAPSAAARPSTDDLLASIRRPGATQAEAPAPDPAAPAAAEAPAAEAAEETSMAGAPMALTPSMPMDEAAAGIPAEEETAATPTLNDPGVAPGAPGLFDTASLDTGPATAGGRPRLSEPALPPTDPSSVAAPPPSFAALMEVKTAAMPAASPAKVAVVVHGLGLSRLATETAIAKLPPAVTLAFSPYARDLRGWVEKAKARGHEVLIELPMESKAFPAEDPGPLGLLTSLDAQVMQERMDTILKEAVGAVGVIDVMGDKFRESEDSLGAVFAKLTQNNLFYVQGEPGLRVGEATVPTATADVVLDERPFRAAIDARLDYAERLAAYQGSAVAVLGPKPVGYERLALWLDLAARKGLTIAPVSQVLIQ